MEKGPEKRKKPRIENLKGHRGPRFGIDRPVPLSPGRPRLPDSVKERRAFLRKKLEEVSVRAIEVVQEILHEPETEDRDLLRAAEIALSHTVPKLEEVETHDDRPLPVLSDQQVESQLALIRASHNERSSGNGTAKGNGVAT